MPSFGAGALFSPETSAAPEPGLPFFTHSAYLKYSMWYLSDGQKCAKVDRVALAYREPSLSLELS